MADERDMAALEYVAALHLAGDAAAADWMLDALRASRCFPRRIRLQMRNEALAEISNWLQDVCRCSSAYYRASLIADAAKAMQTSCSQSLPNIGRFRDLGDTNRSALQQKIKPILFIEKWPGERQILEIIV